MLILVDSCWFVVVNIRVRSVKEVVLECICDYADNRYIWGLDEIASYLNLKEIRDLNYRWPDRFPSGGYNSREIPYDVITEVLLGKEDDRFEDYDKGEF